MSANGEYDFAVVGGGVVGMCMAFGLARQGRKVVVLDEGDNALRASRGNFALIWLQGKGLGMAGYARWSRRSVSLWREFADELEAVTGIDVALEQRGGFLLYLNEEELAGRVRGRDQLDGLLGPDSYPVEMMDNEALRKMLPAIGPDVVGGSYCALDGHVNALRLFRAVHAACAAVGVTYRPNSRVDAAASVGGGFELSGSFGTVRSERVVLAAGLGNAELAPQLGLTAPVRPERGQIIVTEKLDRFLDYPVGTIRQTDEGGVMIGASREGAGFNTATTTPVIADLASDAIRMFPMLARARVVRTWSALRILSPDECPMYQHSETHPGAFLVTCHSGVTLAAAHALDLAAELATGVLPERFDIFHPRRFADVSQAA